MSSTVAVAVLDRDYRPEIPSYIPPRFHQLIECERARIRLALPCSALVPLTQHACSLLAA